MVKCSVSAAAVLGCIAIFLSWDFEIFLDFSSEGREGMGGEGEGQGCGLEFWTAPS
jgi:hypothetical protein